MAKLRITVGAEHYERELKKPLVVAGRSPELDVPLPTISASREHFRLGRLKDGGWGLEDLGSTNGTFLNGQQIKSARIKHKDTITIGKDCTIVFHDPPPLAVPAKKAPTAPLALKSKAQREKERLEEERRRKLEERKAEAVGSRTGAIVVDDTEAIRITDETMLDRVLHGDGGLDALVKKGRKVVFGDYELEKRLSEGGMGVVFKARHALAGNMVALKVLKQDKVDEENITRFKQEAWAISAFNHANIVKITDLAKVGAMPYIAMEFVDGHDLLAVGVRRELTYWQIAEVIWKMADVLHVVHARNIWHRDIKPQNILMDKSGEVRLIDFGIATIEREQADAAKTGEGLIMGTPAFLSPEQAARGKMGAIDGRADLYSLGAVMYYLLTGRRPFTGKTPLEVLYSNMKDEPPHPHTVDDLIPDGLVQIALRLLRKQPDDRYQSAAELKEAIEGWRRSADGKKEKELHDKILELRARKAAHRARQQQAEAQP
ncbi:MAG: protein kinase domain-containing protein [Planctomycetaceae bacterium]